MPVFSMHTIDDLIVPIEHEEEYAEDVLSEGKRQLFRQAFVDRAGHCNFTSAELLAAIQVLEDRVETGRWGPVSVDPDKLSQFASSFDLEEASEPTFIRYRPGEFIGDRSDSLRR